MWTDYKGKCPICAGVTYREDGEVEGQEQCGVCGWYREFIPHCGYLTLAELQQWREDNDLPPVDPEDHNRAWLYSRLPDLFEDE